MSSSRRLLLLSNSTLHPTGYLEYAEGFIKDFLDGAGAKEVLFVPYALADMDGYESVARKAFESLGFSLRSVHRTGNPSESVRKAEAIFVGGGNTFRLLKALYDNGMVEAIRRRVMEEGVPYIGSSAGTNVATKSICTTNDMPIVYPPSFDALGLVPFNINPHYIETDPGSTHQGETREKRIRQYQEVPGASPVLALKEGSILRVEGDRAELMGDFEALLFKGDKEPVRYPNKTDFSFLL